jgi:hypothetical protein
MNPCEHCPVGSSCIAITTNHEGYCKWAASGDQKKIDKVIELSKNGPQTPVMPSIFNQIKSASTAAIDFIRGGCKIVDKTEQERRLEICRVCDKFDGSRCTICGCMMKWKAAIESSRCPLDPPKW